MADEVKKASTRKTAEATKTESTKSAPAKPVEVPINPLFGPTTQDLNPAYDLRQT